MSNGLSQDWVAVRRSALRSQKINAVSWGAEALFWRLLLACDDAGRYPADHGEMAAGPLKRRMLVGAVDVETAEQWLRELLDADLVVQYEVGGERFIEIVAFETKRRSPRVKCPPPPSGTSMPHGCTTHAPWMPHHKTRQDKTRQDKTGEEKRDPRARARGTRQEETLFPPELDSPAVREAWDRWEAGRSGKKYKPQARAAAIRKLAKFADGDQAKAIDMLEHSLAGGWAGLFPPDGPRRPRDDESPAQRRRERSRAMLRRVAEEGLRPS